MKMPSSAQQIVILLLASSALGTAVNAVRPDGIPWVIDPSAGVDPGENPEIARRAAITLDELREHYAAGTAAIIDARRREMYLLGHLATAINVPAREKEQYQGRIFEMIPSRRLIVIYCESESCEAANELFVFLSRLGYAKERIKICLPGWEALKGAGLPIVVGEDP